MKELKVRLCKGRLCTEYYDAKTGKFVCGFGTVDCVCQEEVK